MNNVINKNSSKMEKAFSSMAGFTLIESIGAVAIIAILIGLLLPAVQR